MLSVQTVGNIQGSPLSSNMAGRLFPPHKFAEPPVKLLWIFFKSDNKTNRTGMRFASCEIGFPERKRFYFSETLLESQIPQLLFEPLEIIIIIIIVIARFKRKET